MTANPLFSNNVSWTGDNSGLYLKETESGPYTSLASYFRVAWSPFGAGLSLILIERDASPARRPVKLYLYDNEAMAKWILEEYASHFQQFRDLAEMSDLTFMKLESHKTEGTLETAIVESFKAPGYDISLRWAKLGKSYFVKLGQKDSATGKDEMFTAFVESWEAGGSVNGVPLSGRVFPRTHVGRPSSTAFLAFSETWLR